MPILNNQISSIVDFLNQYYMWGTESYSENYILRRLEKEVYISALRDDYLSKNSNGIVSITNKGKSLRDNK